MAATKLIPVIVTTEWRGVFFGWLAPADIQKREFALKGARMAIYWGTTRGVMELAATGPTSNSKISAAADIDHLHGVTAIFRCTKEATQKWEE